MALKDIPKFNGSEYAKQLKQHSTAELKQREIRKMRQQWAGFFSVTGGVLGAVHSFGGTLVVSALGARRWSIASQKLALIRAELQRRDIDLHKTQVKDVTIPLVSFGLGAGIGFELHEALEQVTNVGAPECKWGFSSNAGDTLTAAIDNPEDFAEGISSGIAENSRDLTLAIHDIPDGIVPGSGLSEQVLNDHTD